MEATGAGRAERRPVILVASLQHVYKKQGA